MNRFALGGMLLFALILLAACGGTTMNEPATGGQLTVSDAAANLTLPTETGSVYLTIANGTNTDDALVGASVPGCATVELHEVIMDGDVMMMQPVAGQRIPVPAGQTVMLKQGGLHIMCIGKTGEFAVGDSVPVTLQFEKGGMLEVSAAVVEPGEMAPAMGDMGGDQ